MNGNEFGSLVLSRLAELIVLLAPAVGFVAREWLRQKLKTIRAQNAAQLSEIAIAATERAQLLAKVDSIAQAIATLQKENLENGRSNNTTDSA